MANKTLKIDLLFNANIKEALRQMLQLQQSLSLLATSQPMTSFSLTPLLKEAQRSAIDLKIALNNAMNVDTGRLNLNKFQSELNRSGKSILQYAQQLQALGPSGVRAFLQVALAVAQADTKMFNLSGGTKKLMDTLGNTIRWQLTSSAIHGVMSAFSDTISYAKELDTSLNNIRIVTGKSADLMARFAKEANSMAKLLSTTTTKYTDASLIYYQLGLNDKEVKERTDTTVKLANVTGETAELVSEWMTSIWNNFDDGTMALERYADMIAKLGAATASSADEIATGLEKFAAVADTVGLSYEYATSALATVTAETRQSADVVGTAFKTLFARIEGLKFGETLEDGTDLNQYSLALQKVGVNIKDANGELKDMDTILDLTGARWLTLNKDQQIALALQVAGIRQYNQFMALMENWDVMLDNLKLVEQSNGALEELNRIYEESMAASQERMKAASEELKALIVGGDDLIPLYNFAGGALEVITELLEAFGGLPTIILGVATALTKLYLPQIASFASLLGVGFTSAFSSIGNALKGKGFTPTSNFKTDTAMTAANMAASVASTEQDSLALFTLSLAKIDIARIENESKLNEAAKQRIEWLRKELEMKLLLVLEGEKAILAANEEVEAKGNVLINKGYLGEDVRHLQGLSEKLGQLLAHGSLAQTMVTLAQTMGGATMNTLSREDFKTNMSKLLDEMKSKASALGGSVKNISFKPVEDSLLNFVNTGKGLDDLLNKIKELNSELNKAGQGTLNTTIGEMAPEQDEAILRKSSKTYDGMAAAANLLENDSIDTVVNHLNKIDENKFSSKKDKDYISKKKSQAKKLLEENKALKDESKWRADNNKSAKEYNEAVEKNDKAIKKFNKDTAKSMSTLKKNSKTLKTNIRSTKEYENGIKDVGKELKDFSSESTDAAKSAEGLEEATTTLNKEAADMEENIRNGGSSFTHWSDNFANGLSNLASYAMGLNMLSSAFENLFGAIGRGDATWKDYMSSISSVLMSTMMIIPAIQNMTKMYRDSAIATLALVAEKGREVLVEKLNILQKGLATLASKIYEKQKQKEGQETKKNILVKILEGLAGVGALAGQGPKGWVTAAISLAMLAPIALACGASIVGGLSGGAKEAKQEEVSKGTESLEAINENQELAESVTDLTEEYNALRNAGESTADVLEDMREKIPELIESYKELAKTMGTHIDTSELEKAYEVFLATGDTSLLEKALEKLNTEVLKNKKSIAETTVQNATELMIDSARDGKGRLDGDMYHIDLGEPEAEVDAELKKIFGDAWDGDNVRIDSTNSAEVLNYYEKAIKARDRLKELGYEDTAAYERLADDVKEMAENAENAYAALESKYETLEKELLDLDTEGLDKISGTIDGTTISGDLIKDLLTYELYRDELIKSLVKEYEMTEANALAYLEATDALGHFEEAHEFFKKGGLGFNKDANEQTIKDIKEWFANLPEEERTLAMTIDYTTVATKEDAAAALEEARKKAEEAAILQEAEKLEVDEGTFDTYTEGLADLNKELDENENLTKQIALNNLKISKGLTTLTKSWDDNFEIIKRGNKASLEYAEAIGEVKTAFEEMFGVKPSTEYIEQYSNEINEMVNGNLDSLQKLQDALAEDYIMNMDFSTAINDDWSGTIKDALSQLKGFLDDIDTSIEVGEGTTLSSDFLNSILDMLDAGVITSEQLDKLFRAKGFELEVEAWDTIDGPIKTITRTTYPEGKPNKAVTEVIEEKEKIKVPIINGRKPKGQLSGVASEADIKVATYTKSTDKRVIDTSAAEEKADKAKDRRKKLEDELDRYHEINEIISDTERELDKLGKAKDKAFGASKIALMDKEIAKQKELIENNKKLLEEAEKYYQLDRSKLLSSWDVQLDSAGRISNYEEIQLRYIDRLNANAGNEKLYEDIEEEYEAFKNAAEKYEESLNKVEELAEKVNDELDALYERNLEKIEYEVEFKIEADEFTMEVLEHFLSRLEDDAFAAADAIALIGLQMEVTAGQIDTYMTGINKVLGATLSPEEIQKVMAGDLSNIDTSKLTEQQIEDLKEYANGLMEVENQLREQHTAVHEKLTETIEAWNEEFDKNMAKFEKYNTVVENYKNIIDIVGKGTLGISDETMRNMYEAQKNIAIDLLEAARIRKESAQTTYDEMKIAYDNAVMQYGEDSEIAKKWKEQMDIAEENLDEATSEFLDAWQNALLAAADAFLHNVETIIQNFEKSIAGIYGNLEALEEAFDRQKEINERYLEDYEKTYEINKLNRKINQDIAKTTSNKSTKELRDLQNELLNMNKEGNQISKLDIEYMQKKYDLLLAEQALRDAQNAKSTVKLSRDSEGNYSYVYTADLNNVDLAMLSYEDAKYALEDWSRTSLETVSENIIQIYSAWSQAMLEIMMDNTLNEEERERKMAETNQYYLELMGYYTDEATKLTEYGYQTNSLYHIDMADSINDSIVGHIMPDITNWKELYTKSSTLMQGSTTALDKLIKQFAIDVDEAMNKAGISTGKFETLATEDLRNVETQAGSTKDAIINIKTEAEAQLPLAADAAKDFETKFNGYLLGIIDKIGDPTGDGVLGAILKLINGCKEGLRALKALEEKDYSYTGGGNNSDGTTVTPITPDTTPSITSEEAITSEEDEKSGEYTLPGARGWFGTTYRKLYTKNADGNWILLDKGYAAKNNYNDAKITKYATSTFTISNDSNKKTHIIEITKANGAKEYMNFTDVHDLYGGVAAYFPDNWNDFVKKMELANVPTFDTGGYTGSWGPEGRLAMLHQKEIVLNAHDTENLLSIISMVRDMSDRIELNARAMQYGLTAAYTANNIKSQNDTLQLEVHITAEFPNATNHSEIEEAFRNLTNLASQYANRKF